MTTGSAVERPQTGGGPVEQRGECEGRSWVELAIRVQAGDLAARETLNAELLGWVDHRLAKLGYYLPWGERQDMVQEVMIGIQGLIERYNPRGAKLVDLLDLVVKRRARHALRNQCARKHELLTRAVHRSAPPPEGAAGEKQPLLEVIRSVEPGPSHTWEPVDVIVEAERLQEGRERADQLLAGLSELQRAAAEMHWIEGLPYKEIASRLGRSWKSIDNALRKAKPKIERNRERLQKSGGTADTPIGAAGPRSA